MDRYYNSSTDNWNLGWSNAVSGWTSSIGEVRMNSFFRCAHPTLRTTDTALHDPRFQLAAGHRSARSHRWGGKAVAEGTPPHATSPRKQYCGLEQPTVCLLERVALSGFECRKRQTCFSPNAYSCPPQSKDTPYDNYSRIIRRYWMLKRHPQQNKTR